MKINKLSSTHKKYIKKYGAKKAAEKFNLNLTKAKSYEKKYKGSSYQGKRSLSKSNVDDSDIFSDDEPQHKGTNIGNALGFNPSDMGGMSAMGGMPGAMGGMPGAMGGMPGAMGMGGMPGAMGGMPGAMPMGMGGHMGMEGAMSPMSPTMANPGMLNVDGAKIGMPPQMPAMPGAMGMAGMPAMGGMPAMPGMFQGQKIDTKNVDPLMVEISAPARNFNSGMMPQGQGLPMFHGNLAQTAGGNFIKDIKQKLHRLSFLG